MENNIKDKFVKGLKNSAKLASNSIKNIYNKSVSNIAYMASTSLFYVVELPEGKKTNKLFYGVFDDNTLTYYVKASKSKAYREYLKKGSKIQMDDEKDTIYSIDKVDLKTTYDYLLKFNNKYKSIPCYKIHLKLEE